MLVVPAEVVLGPAALEALSDAALVARAQAGDMRAFGVLFERWQPKIVRSLSMRLHGRVDLAEDLAADTFARALANLHTYRDEGRPFSAWLYRIAHNRFVDYLRLVLLPDGRLREEQLSVIMARKGLHRLAHGAGDSWDELLNMVTEGRARRDDDLESFETQHLLASALAALTPGQRRCVELRWLEDRSIAETARRMGKDEDAIKQLQVRAFARLRPLLADYAPGGSA